MNQVMCKQPLFTRKVTRVARHAISITGAACTLLDMMSMLESCSIFFDESFKSPKKIPKDHKKKLS